MAAVRGLEGRSGMTRLNSTQVFCGMPPIKLQGTALFRAWSDPASEVEAPFNQPMARALPVKLSELGPLLVRAADSAVSNSMPPHRRADPLDGAGQDRHDLQGQDLRPLVIESNRPADQIPGGQRRPVRGTASAPDPLHADRVGP